MREIETKNGLVLRSLGSKISTTNFAFHESKICLKEDKKNICKIRNCLLVRLNIVLPLVPDISFCVRFFAVEIQRKKVIFRFFGHLRRQKMPFRRVMAKQVPIQYLVLPETPSFLRKTQKSFEPLVSEIFFCSEKFYVRHKLPLFRF